MCAAHRSRAEGCRPVPAPGHLHHPVYSRQRGGQQVPEPLVLRAHCGQCCTPGSPPHTFGTRRLRVGVLCEGSNYLAPTEEKCQVLERDAIRKDSVSTFGELFFFVYFSLFFISTYF